MRHKLVIDNPIHLQCFNPAISCYILIPEIHDHGHTVMLMNVDYHFVALTCLGIFSLPQS